jgi:hypothetical protein
MRGQPCSRVAAHAAGMRAAMAGASQPAAACCMACLRGKLPLWPWELSLRHASVVVALSSHPPPQHDAGASMDGPQPHAAAAPSAQQLASRGEVLGAAGLQSFVRCYVLTCSVRPVHCMPPLWGGRRFIGEWYEKEPGHDAPTPEQISSASRNCFIVGAVYMAWLVFALGCVCVQSARAKRGM